MKTKRNIYGLVVMMIFTLIGADTLYSMENQDPAQVFIEYYNALKKGDVDKMMSHLAGNSFLRYKDVLEKDPNYSDFLKSYYDGSTLHISDTVVKDSDAMVEVQIQFSNGNKSISKFHLQKFEGDIWRITDQLLY